MLTEFSVTQAGKPLEFSRATASYEQPGYPAAAAIDHKRGKTNGWSVLGKTGMNHVIYSEVAGANSSGPPLKQLADSLAEDATDKPDIDVPPAIEPEAAVDPRNPQLHSRAALDSRAADG